MIGMLHDFLLLFFSVFLDLLHERTERLSCREVITSNISLDFSGKSCEVVL